jgi:CheY-like chemotaxis protein
VVEDESDLREVIVENLQQAGYDVRQAADGHEAFEILAKRDVDVVLCDVNMPLCDGVTLLKRTHALLGLRIPFAFLTADSSRQVSDLLLLKTQAIFSKPFELDAVLSWLETVSYDVTARVIDSGEKSAEKSAGNSSEKSGMALRESIFLTLETLGEKGEGQGIHVVRLEAVSDRELRVTSPPKAFSVGELFAVRSRPPFKVRVNRMGERGEGRNRVRELWLGVLEEQPQAAEVITELNDRLSEQE